jgi:hypothetical protein
MFVNQSIFQKECNAKSEKNDLQREKLTCFQNNKKGNDCIFVYVEFHEESLITIDLQLKISSIETNMPIFNRQW